MAGQHNYDRNICSHDIHRIIYAYRLSHQIENFNLFITNYEVSNVDFITWFNSTKTHTYKNIEYSNSGPGSSPFQEYTIIPLNWLLINSMNIYTTIGRFTDKKINSLFLLTVNHNKRNINEKKNNNRINSNHFLNPVSSSWSFYSQKAEKKYSHIGIRPMNKKNILKANENIQCHHDTSQLSRI